MSKPYIRIVSGTYKNQDMSGKVFQLVQEFQMGTRSGGFVAVRNQGQVADGPLTMRVSVDSPADYEFVTGSDISADITEQEIITAAQSAETDDEIMARIRERFEILNEMATAATAGDIRAMIVSGPPGVGKSYGVERIVEQACLMDRVAGKRLRADVVKGSTTALGLYCTLYKYSDPNCVLVFDDCDSVLLDDTALNLLKGALDSGKKRKISWLADSHMLRREGVPDSFEFRGSVIFITNLKFDQMKSQKLRDHLDALQSRCHYLDLTLDTMRDKILRIKQIAADGDLFQDYDFDQCVQDEIVDFMTDNCNRFREMSLRMAIKVADLRKSFPLKWKAMAQVTCMKSA